MTFIALNTDIESVLKNLFHNYEQGSSVVVVSWLNNPKVVGSYPEKHYQV
jgi:hypothetical protein